MGRRVDGSVVRGRARPLDAGHLRIDPPVRAQWLLRLPPTRHPAHRRDAWPAAHRRGLCIRAGRVVLLRRRWSELRVRRGPAGHPHLHTRTSRYPGTGLRVVAGWVVASAGPDAAVRHPGLVATSAGDAQRHDAAARVAPNGDRLVARRSWFRCRLAGRSIRADDGYPRVTGTECGSASILAAPKSKRSFSI